MTSQPPADPPTSGPAVEVAPHGEKVRPKTTVYLRASRTLWIFWPDRWQAADVRARHDWPTGATSYQVELNTFDDLGSHRVSRSFLWGPDSVRAVEDHGDGHENVNSQS